MPVLVPATAGSGECAGHGVLLTEVGKVVDKRLKVDVAYDLLIIVESLE